MGIIVSKDYQDLSVRAAEVIINCVKKKPDAVLGLATGSTPLGVYKQLVAAYKQGIVSFKNVTSFNLDEYIGLQSDNPQSYHYYMWQNFFDHIDIKKENVFIPNGNLSAAELEKECQRYEQLIQDRGCIDVQLLGIGHNGHVGFNEPGSAFDSVTRVVDLDQKTITANARFFSSAAEVPRQAITMGLGTIMKARQIVLVASGAGKADIVAAALYGPATTDIPASILQHHKNVTVIIDQAAAALL